ncbi:hypothetical protein H696_04425 [Fonticula alba]|uniref:Small ribosomal subunit protein mS41 n=1 Tax=Fonticula alba TaxID=691883 RepID=A0A058Z442_FONAL|nr:hypothetical protein H696_04425 [Fonticula alba]KCV69005.1 hypothetical protein H696_04425 [Fonticula alba]|eukprot:XP_009496576.1 hypothetical protein H696_04425 [Fonticula alba]
MLLSAASLSGRALMGRVPVTAAAAALRVAPAAVIPSSHSQPRRFAATSPFAPVTGPTRRTVPEQRNGITLERFVTHVGAGLDRFLPKMESWEALFSMDKIGLDRMGMRVDQRKKLLAAMNWYRLGFDPQEGVNIKHIDKKNRKKRSKLENMYKKRKIRVEFRHQGNERY